MDIGSIPPHVWGHLLGTNQLGRVGVSLGGHAPCHSNPPSTSRTAACSARNEESGSAISMIQTFCQLELRLCRSQVRTMWV